MTRNSEPHGLSIYVLIRTGHFRYQQFRFTLFLLSLLLLLTVPFSYNASQFDFAYFHVTFSDLKLSFHVTFSDLKKVTVSNGAVKKRDMSRFRDLLACLKFL